MGRPYVISDLHFCHSRITEFRPEFSSMEEHDDYIIEQWNKTISKRDSVTVLGDVAFNKQGLEKLGKLRGTKKFILGNHDRLSVDNYAQYGKILQSLVKYKKSVWLSHCPIHPDELRGIKNIHGHIHSHDLRDDRYINVCVEAIDFKPICLERFVIFRSL
jgi:calcineurin-like phosphoesterase family protein